MALKLWKHQERAVARMLRGNLLLAHEMGLGKTMTILQVLSILEKEKKLKPTLILTKKSVMLGFLRTAEEHFPELFRVMAVLDQAGPKRKALLQDKELRIYITNHEAFAITGFDNWVIQRGIKYLAVDEGHGFKDFKALRTQKLTRIADLCERVWIATGTPVLNSPMDLWPLFRMIDRRILGDNPFVFRSRCCIDVNESRKNQHNYFPNYKTRLDYVPTLSQLIDPKMDKACREECLDLPKHVRETVLVTLPPSEQKAVDELSEDLVTNIDIWKNGKTEQRVVAVNLVVTKLTRLRQLLSGVIVSDDGQVHTFKGAKLEALKDVLQTICPQNKAVVWTSFVPSYKLIEELCVDLSLGFTQIVGGQTSKERQAAIDLFRDSPASEVSVMISNPAAGGVGIDGLQVAKYAVYYSKDFSIANDLQSEARTYRAGSEMHDECVRIDIVAANTVDEDIDKALSNKQKLSDALIDIREAIHERRDDQRNSRTAGKANSFTAKQTSFGRAFEAPRRRDW